ncbi:MAG: hypothetical protein IJ688_14025 [Treponema sp.]|nr:hypothetical protein [Treponema sp.]
MFEDVEEIRPAEGEEELHFYYNRAERIARAPQNVQDYYNGGMRPVRGFKIFFTKQNRFIFFGLIFFVAFAWIYSGLNRTRNQTILNGVVYDLSAFSYEDEIYVTIKSRFKNTDEIRDSIPFEASVFAVNSDNQIQEKVFLQGLAEVSGEQSVRTKIRDFDIKRIDVILDSQGASKELSAFVTR